MKIPTCTTYFWVWSKDRFLGLILYAIFVAPLFDIEFYLAFADDNYIPKFSNNIPTLIDDMDRALESTTKWLKD